MERKDHHVKNETPPPLLSNSSLFNFQFSISDTGPGIAQEEIQGLFEAFSRARAGRLIREGTGLGLTISQKFVQMQGGDITVNSDYGHGATFLFTIPVKHVSGADVAPTLSGVRFWGWNRGSRSTVF